MKCKTVAFTALIIFLGICLLTWAQEQISITHAADDPPSEEMAESTHRLRNLPPDDLTDAQKWALAVTAQSFEGRHERHDRLDAGNVSDEYIQSKKEHLKKMWGVASREDMLSSLRNMVYGSGSYNARFLQYREFIRQASPQEIQEFLALNENNYEIINSFRIAQKYHEELGDKGISAMDYTQGILLTRWGYMVGYLNRDEAWGFIMPLARQAQQQFDSWEQLGRSNLVGNMFREHSVTVKYSDTDKAIFQRLLDMPTSPWNQLPWDLPLGGDSATPEDAAVPDAAPTQTPTF